MQTKLPETLPRPDELVNEWINTLRSGQYKQGIGRLHFNDRFCCLGVLCDMVTKHPMTETEKTIFQWEEEYPQSMGTTYRFNASRFVLPTYLQDYIGFDDEQMSELVTMNDTGKPFEKIADKIEEFQRCKKW